MSTPPRLLGYVASPVYMADDRDINDSSEVASSTPAPFINEAGYEVLPRRSNGDSDIETLPSYGTIERDLPPAYYCKDGLCALRRLSCMPAQCCRNRELLTRHRGERRRRIRLGPVLCVAAMIWTFMILLVAAAVAPGGIIDALVGSKS